MSGKINLMETPDTVTWSPVHFVFIEKRGPFATTAPSAWQEFHQRKGAVAGQAINFLSLYRFNLPEPIYRAGMVLAAAPAQVPEPFHYENFQGGKYARFTLYGSYSQLPEACGFAMERAAQLQLSVREDDFYLEHYVNDPAVTPDSQLITEILIPIR